MEFNEASYGDAPYIPTGPELEEVRIGSEDTAVNPATAGDTDEFRTDVIGVDHTLVTDGDDESGNRIGTPAEDTRTGDVATSNDGTDGEHGAGDPSLSSEQYWGSEPYPAWSAKLEFPEGVSYDEFQATVNSAAGASGHRYTGFITRDPGSGKVTSFTRTIYPRQKYPVTAPEDCAAGMANLGTSFGVAVEPDTVQPDSYRTPIGLYVGQDDDYDRPPEHSVEGIQATLTERGLQSTATPAEIFTVRFTDGGITNYTEPVAVVTGPLHEISSVCDLAVELGQERFTLEQFPVDGAAQVQMIETVHCQEPEWKTGRTK